MYLYYFYPFKHFYVTHQYVRMGILDISVLMSLSKCQHQFRNRRWNCSTTPRGINVFGRVMNQGTRMWGHMHSIKKPVWMWIYHLIYIWYYIFIFVGFRHSGGSFCARSVFSSLGHGCDQSVHTWWTGEMRLWQEGQGSQLWGWVWTLPYACVPKLQEVMPRYNFPGVSYQKTTATVLQDQW